ncbi:hypothetical protein KUTeg_015191 [Tegillarca granosa]|uniref:FLYWCH-type domain-containing protein n=1 Tax=Tegillarca granosa TaxID=220873 RepID=A0ABQ9EU54_TEGGR|nr:hypothetical protein KUTeg_015191 [Tegillarca granosa]
MGSLVNADTTEADTQEAHSTEAHSTEANAPHNNSSFEIENIPYQEPTIIQENSIKDKSIGDVTPATYKKTYTMIEVIEGGSQKGKRKQRKDTIHWWCSVRNKSGRCPASVQQHGNEFSSGRHTHNHTARPGVATAVEIIKQVKSESSSNVFESASSIVVRVVSTNTTTSDPEGSSLTANRVRERLRPKEPQDLTLQIAQNYIPDGFLRADVKVGDERHLIFATEDQLQLLDKAKQWFIDGTFKVVRAPFYQILSIHSFVRSGEECKMILLVFCLMSGRRQKDYIKV